MKILLNIKDIGRVPFFKMVETLDYVTDMKELEGELEVSHLSDLMEAFNEVKLYKQGKKELQSAKDFLDEF